MGRASKDKRDIYYRKAKEEGFRARSAYKLLQVDEEFDIFRGVTRAVDLCAAPGSWSQVLASKLSENANAAVAAAAAGADVPTNEVAYRIVAVDLQELAPIDGVSILQGDITSEQTAQAILDLLGGGEGEQTLLSNASIEDTSTTSSSNNNSTTDRTKRLRSGEAVSDQQQQQQQQTICNNTTTNHNNTYNFNASAATQPASGLGAAVGLSGPSTVAPTHTGLSGASPIENSTSNASSASKLKAQLVVCDGAPDVTGMHELDEYVQHQLLLAALRIATCVLEPNGCFVTKMFRGPNTPFLVAKSEVFFDSVVIVKPKSSRNASMESFMVCQGFRAPPGIQPTLSGYYGTTSAALPHPFSELAVCAPSIPSSGIADLPPANAAAVTRFLSCGSLSAWDADLCYDREKGQSTLAPVHPPIQAPYLQPKQS